MLFSTFALIYAAMLVGRSLAAPVPVEWTDDLVVRTPPTASYLKVFTHAAEAATLTARIKKNVNPRPNGAVYWSGSHPGPDGKLVTVEAEARRIAKAQGKETLEDHLENQGIHIPLQAQNPHSKKLWAIASNKFAQRTKGDTHAYLGPVMRPQSVYKKDEKPTLMANPHVPKLTEHYLPHGGSVVVKGQK